MTYGRPAVYVTESFQALQQTNVASATSIPAFAAAHPRGPETPQLIESFGQYQQLFGAFSDTPGSMLPYAVSDFFGNGGTSCYVLRVGNTDATSASLNLLNTGGTSGLTATAKYPGVWGQDIAITVSNVTGSNGSTYFNLSVYLTTGNSQALVETFVNLSMNPADPLGRYCLPILNSTASGSQYLKFANDETYYSSGESDLAAVSSATALTGGNDGSETPDLGTAVPAALDQVPDQIMAVNLPGVSDTTILNELIAWAGQDGDKMIVCDGPAPSASIGGSTYPATVVAEYLAMTQNGSPSLSPSQYGVLYGPWRSVTNPASASSGATVYLPPGSAVLAKWQQNDTQIGPWNSPAGTRYPISALSMEATFSAAQLDTLNLANVNVIRPVPGYGTLIMGDRTLATGYPDMFLPVQREMLALSFEMQNLLQFALFEQNGPALWSDITNVLTNYLNQQLQAGVFAGNSAADSYQVICDSSNNTPTSAQTGLVNISVLVALVSPAEWIQLNLTQQSSIAATAS